MRRRIAAVSRRAGARAPKSTIGLEPTDRRELAIRSAHRAAEVRLFRVQQPVQPGSHIAPDPMGLELEDAAVRTDEPQERDDLLLSLQVDDMASPSLRSEGPHLQRGKRGLELLGRGAVGQDELDVRAPRPE